MAIIATTQKRTDNVTTVTVTSDLSGTIFYHWYVDGSLVASTASASYSFFLAADEHVRITVIDTTDPLFDPVAGAPAGYPARRTLSWVRSVWSGIAKYRVEQQQDAGAWTVIGEVINEPARWSYRLLTPRLVDLAAYNWRIVPVDVNGDDQTLINIAQETVVRTPDAVDFSATFDPATTKVTFAAVA